MKIQVKMHFFDGFRNRFLKHELEYNKKNILIYKES